MIDKRLIAQTYIEGNATISVLQGVLRIQGESGEMAELGDVTHEKLNELSSALNKLNQHLFPQARFDAKRFLAEQKQNT